MPTPAEIAAAAARLKTELGLLGVPGSVPPAAYVLRVVQRADGTVSEVDGLYIEGFDADFAGGRGRVELTSHRTNARRFPSSASAFAYWQQAHGTRPDGAPNRPLTAYTVSIDPLEENTHVLP